MENGDSLYARIAELEKENEKLKIQNTDLVELSRYDKLPNPSLEFRHIPKLIEEHGEEYVKEVFAEDYQYYIEEEQYLDEEDEVPCYCPKCHAEGKCYVTNRREIELRELGLVESCCPFGDCAASHSDSDSDSDSEEDDEDEEEEEEVLENLTCAQLKQRLRAINKPVGGRKADLIQRIREHERLTAALFEED